MTGVRLPRSEASADSLSRELAARMQVIEFIFRASAEGILIADEQGVLRQVNPAAAAIVGLPIDQMIGRRPHDCFHQFPALVNLFNRTGDQVLDVRLPRRRLAEGIAATLPSGSRIVMLQDVTEKREVESRRDALVKAVTHDLRNPISAIEGYADLVTKFGDLNAQQQRFVTRIRQTSIKLYDVAGALVDLAWMEAGMPLARAPIHLNNIINHVVLKLSGLAATRHITIAVSLQSPMPPVMGDDDRMELAIYNLLHNAIIYSHPEQTVAVHAWGDTHDAYCAVADQGIGIADDELDLVFDRMYRSRDERVREIPGGGLGLTLARTIIRRHGGDIWASSNLNAGSTFTFVLPTVEM